MLVTSQANYVATASDSGARRGSLTLRPCRYYNPTIGQFTSFDTFENDPGQPLGSNKYAYCAGNPIALVDPSGQNGIDESLSSFTASAILAALPTTQQRISASPRPTSHPSTGPVGSPYIIGFYGADTPITWRNDGNERIYGIETELFTANYDLHMYASRNWGAAYRDVIHALDSNHDGRYDPTAGDALRSIRIFGHSWGGHSALMLAQKISRDSDFQGHNTINVLALIDPVNYTRGDDGGGVPTCVRTFQNWYETNGRTPIIGLGIEPKGHAIYPHRDVQTDLTGVNGMTHFTIITYVRSRLLTMLES